MKMLMRDVSLLDALVGWASSNEHLLVRRGIEVRFGRTNDERPKHSAFLNLRRGGAEADLVLWETGEAAVGLAEDVGSPVMTDEWLTGSDQLEAVVGSMLAVFHVTFADAD
jgi:hypothetical protein